MNNANKYSINFSALTRAGEGLTQWRALAMGFLTVLVVCLLIGLVQVVGTRVGGTFGALLILVFSLLVFAAMIAGSSAVGVLLMDKAREVPQRGIAEAAVFGVASVPKFLMLGIGLFLAVLLFGLVASLIYFLCKIPFLGAVVAFIAHPVLIVIAALFIVACMWVVFPLFAPAVWSGLGFKEALTSVFAIARNRIVPVVLMIMVLYIVMGVIGMLMFTGFLPASTALTGLAGSIMGGGGDAYGNSYNGYGSMDMLTRLMSAFSGSGGFVGALLGMGVLYVMLFALVGLVAMMGMNLLYLEVASGLDTDKSADELDGAFGAFKEKAREAADKARATAERAKAAAAERVQAAAEAREAAARENAEREAIAQQAAEQAQAEQEAEEAQKAVIRREAAERAEREMRESQARAAAAKLQAAADAADAQAAVAPVSTSAPTSSVGSVAAAGAAAVGAAGAVSAIASGAAATPSSDEGSQLKPCKGCHHMIGKDDLFCELCGTKQ